MRFLSPLRYPGGKAKLAPFLSRLVHAQDPRPRAYAEPFAGGAGAALKLLQDGDVESIYINDLNPGIAAFWRAVFNYGPELAERIESAIVDVESWKMHRAVYLSPEGRNDLELGFSTFFLNRANRSGILSARPIGGLEQTGQWKIDARFNRQDLAGRVRLLYRLRDRVHISELDGLEFLKNMSALEDDVLVYVDPPYLVQGDELYMLAFSGEAHLKLANALANMNSPWILTYDADDRITEELYVGQRCAEFNISHTAQSQHVGSEYVVFSPALVLPDLQITAKGSARWL